MLYIQILTCVICVCLMTGQPSQWSAQSVAACSRTTRLSMDTCVFTVVLTGPKEYGYKNMYMYILVHVLMYMYKHELCVCGIYLHVNIQGLLSQMNRM